MPDELMAEMQAVADAELRSLSYVVTRACRAWLGLDERDRQRVGLERPHPAMRPLARGCSEPSAVMLDVIATSDTPVNQLACDVRWWRVLRMINGRQPSGNAARAFRNALAAGVTSLEQAQTMTRREWRNFGAGPAVMTVLGLSAVRGKLGPKPKPKDA